MIIIINIVQFLFSFIQVILDIYNESNPNWLIQVLRHLQQEEDVIKVQVK